MIAVTTVMNYVNMLDGTVLSELRRPAAAESSCRLWLATIAIGVCRTFSPRPSECPEAFAAPVVRHVPSRPASHSLLTGFCRGGFHLKRQSEAATVPSLKLERPNQPIQLVLHLHNQPTPLHHHLVWLARRHRCLLRS